MLACSPSTAVFIKHKYYKRPMSVPPYQIDGGNAEEGGVTNLLLDFGDSETDIFNSDGNDGGGDGHMDGGEGTDFDAACNASAVPDEEVPPEFAEVVTAKPAATTPKPAATTPKPPAPKPANIGGSASGSAKYRARGPGKKQKVVGADPSPQGLQIQEMLGKLIEDEKQARQDEKEERRLEREHHLELVKMMMEK